MNETTPRKLPLVRGIFPWQSILRMKNDVLPYLEKSIETHGETFRVDAPIPFVVLTHPEHIRYVLQTNARNYRKGFGYRNFKLVLGQGLLSSEGEYWRRQRKLVQPAFYKEQVTGVMHLMEAAIDRMAEVWKEKRALGQPVEATTSMIDLSLAIIARALMGESADQYLVQVNRLLKGAYAFIMQRNRALLPIPLHIPTPSNRAFNSLMQELNTLVYQLIAERKNRPDAGDILTMLLHSRDEAGEGMTDEQIRDEFLTMFIAGYDTTAYALSWTLYNLAIYPEIQTKVKDELAALAASGIPLHQQWTRAAYLKDVIQESMRLFPSVWIIGRQALEADVIGGYAIPKGAHMFLAVYHAHRHPDFWPDPLVFRPERFREMEAIPKGYLPFGAGQRLCVGNHFAMVEIQMALAGLLGQFRISLQSDREVPLSPQITLKPGSDIWLKLE